MKNVVLSDESLVFLQSTLFERMRELRRELTKAPVPGAINHWNDFVRQELDRASVAAEELCVAEQAPAMTHDRDPLPLVVLNDAQREYLLRVISAEEEQACRSATSIGKNEVIDRVHALEILAALVPKL